MTFKIGDGGEYGDCTGCYHVEAMGTTEPCKSCSNSSKYELDTEAQCLPCKGNNCNICTDHNQFEE